jgi:hypothetical protein
MKTFKEHIIKTGNKYRLVSKKTGKNLGTYPSKAGAEKRERQVQYFKHMGESSEEHTKCGTPECCGQCDTAINELSAETLKSYKEKAKKDVTSRPSDVLSHGKPRLSYFNTLKGIFTANKKLKAKTPRGRL